MRPPETPELETAWYPLTRSFALPARWFNRRDIALGLAVAAIYFGAAKFGLSLAFATKQVTAVWPPTGVAFAALILLGYRAAPGIYLGAFLANAGAEENLATAAGIALGNTLAGVVGVYLVRRTVGFDWRLSRLVDVLALVVLGAAVACTVSATGGVANLALAGIVPWSEFWSVWWVWWVGDAMGVLLFAPFLLSWLAKPKLGLERWRLFEVVALFVTLGVASHLTFSGQASGATAAVRLEYIVFPFVIWAALRFGQREAASAAVAISCFAVWGAIHERGPFVAGGLDQRLILLEVFMGVMAGTALVLGAVVAERRRAEEAVALARDQLELRVQQRTLELAEANVELRKKNEEVEAFVYIVSHDLRAPLVNIQGFSSELSRSCAELQQRLAGGVLTEDVSQILSDDIPGALRFIGASTSKFQRLIDALLALSRYGRQQYGSEPIDVRVLVEATLDSVRQSIEKTRTTVSVGPLPGARGDATAIGQVFANLIVNALNYLQPGRDGRVEIGGQLHGKMAEYWVRDNGAGIPASAQRRLFQVFQRFHPERAQGEGMGLAIVKRVVERHGGTVSAQSEEGVGTTFRLTLPALELGKE